MVSVNASGPPDDSRELSRRQKEILQVIRESVQSRNSLLRCGDCPGRGPASPSTVSYHLSVLEERGFLSRGSGLPRTMSRCRRAMRQVSPLRQVRTWRTQFASPWSGGLRRVCRLPLSRQSRTHFSCPEIGGDGTLFMLRVSGDSMVNAGISDGDYVVIRQQGEVVSGISWRH